MIRAGRRQTCNTQLAPALRTRPVRQHNQRTVYSHRGSTVSKGIAVGRQLRFFSVSSAPRNTEKPWTAAWNAILDDMRQSSTFKSERIITTPQSSGIEILVPNDKTGYVKIDGLFFIISVLSNTLIAIIQQKTKGS